MTAGSYSGNQSPPASPRCISQPGPAPCFAGNATFKSHRWRTDVALFFIVLVLPARCPWGSQLCRPCSSASPRPQNSVVTFPVDPTVMKVHSHVNYKTLFFFCVDEMCNSGFLRMRTNIFYRGEIELTSKPADALCTGWLKLWSAKGHFYLLHYRSSKREKKLLSSFKG